jgi:enediyne biosynthesis protein E4
VKHYLLVLVLLLFVACGRHPENGDVGTGVDSNRAAGNDSNALFAALPATTTHVDFNNSLDEGLNTNVLLYEYFYNGGGVAIGDMNGDGLQDIYFSGNMTGNKLYLNKGHMQFEDITDRAGVGGRPGPWKTGVTVADVNGDGRPDIFVCYSGKVPGYKRIKQLFINEGNDAAGIPHFSEQAEKYGLADSSYTTQAYFFDYDRDGDLDLLLLNHNPNSLPVLNETGTAAILAKASPMYGIRLFRNDNGHFHDVTEQTGLSSSALTYGLGAGIADINGDGWPDIYISNDYTVPDYYYVNDHHGRFVNHLQESMGHTSQFSMGNNIADINNDALPDIFTLDMLPEGNRRQKLLFAPDNYEKFGLNVRSGGYYQYMRNMLQLNNGNGTFSEIGQLSGISNTDWSWAPLFADYDNDGWKDLFVTNGYLRDYTNMDFIKFMESYTKQKGRLKREDVLDIIDHMPSSNVTSYLFRNNGDLTFSNMTAQWGIHMPSNSNGAAWADMDNDGDLDLVVNNINQPAFIYENRADRMLKNHYLEIRLEGNGGNTQGIGAKLTLYTGTKLQYLEQEPSQGYQSSVSPILHFGLGKDNQIDSLRVVWPRGREQLLIHPGTDQLLTVKERNATKLYKAAEASTAISGELTSIFGEPAAIFREVRSPIAFRHAASTINDFKRQPQMVNPQSFSGPCMIKGDVNGDGLEDIYVGGGNGQAGVLYIGQKDGRFTTKDEPAFDADHLYEDADALFFDANGDGKTDLYVASGGYHNYLPGDSLLQDRLYLGDGKGNFTRSRGALPAMLVSKGCVRMTDINGDGFPDLYVGSRVIPGQYPVTPPGYLLINDGKGHFTDRIQELAPELQMAGMVTDAAWVDLNGDKRKDLIVVGEWMPLMVFVNENGKLTNRTADYFDKEYRGWWNKLLVGDFDGDGRPDILVGNLGLNAQCRASDSHPAELYYKDFDGNGTMDPVFCYYIGDTSYPFMSRDELLQQIGNMSKRFPDYKSYADAGLTNIFPGDELKGAGHLTANCLETVCFSLGGNGKFMRKGLPLQVQFSPVCTISVLDYDHDGRQDLLLCGNMNHARLRFGKFDANYGILLHGDGKGNFSYIDQRRSGFRLRGDVRSVLSLDKMLLFGINQDSLRAYQLIR